MAGGGIIPTWAEYRMLQRLKHYHLAMVLTTLDEDGWRSAQDLLRGYGQRDEYRTDDNPEKTGDTQ